MKNWSTMKNWKKTLIVFIAIRWIWFIFVEHISESNDFFTNMLKALNGSVVGRFAHSFALFNFAAGFWMPLWTLSFYIPVLCAIYKLVMKVESPSPEDAAQISKREKMTSRIKMILWEMVGIRLTFFIVSRIMTLPANILAFQEWFKAIPKLGSNEILLLILSWMWSALLYVIPVVLILERYRFISRMIPYVFGELKMRIKIGSEKADHFILHKIELNSFYETFADMRNNPTYPLSDHYKLRLEHSNGAYDVVLCKMEDMGAKGDILVEKKDTSDIVEGKIAIPDQDAGTDERYLSVGVWDEIDGVRFRIDKERI